MKRHVSSSFWCVLCMLIGTIALSQTAFPQEAIAPDAKTFHNHVVSRAPLVYPAIAKAAQIQGTVVLDVMVGADGAVISTKAISGPPMLIQAATDSAKQWRFRPFEKDGKPAPAQGRLFFTFSLGDMGQSTTAKEPAADKHALDAKPIIHVIRVKNITPANSPDAKIASKFFPLWNKCTQGLIAHRRDSKTVSTCKQAADVASTFPADNRYIEKRSAFVYAATAFANVGDFNDGEIYAQKAVAEVKLGHDDNGGSGAAYSTLGQIEAVKGDLADADRDLNTAEDFERKGVVWAMKNAPAIVPEYTNPLLHDLRAHAYVLNRLNRSVDAQDKLDEARKLSQ